MIIVGAGMAGLLAARLLAHHKPVVHEAQSELPNNHGAVLRFQTNVIGEALKIPFKRVEMIKCVVGGVNPVADTLAYSKKNTDHYRSDRSAVQGFKSEDRYIAPPDLIARMAEGVDIRYNSKFEFDTDNDQWPFHGDLIISTVPMPLLMKGLHYPHHTEFTYRHGSNISAIVQDCDAYVSLIVPHPRYAFSRVSLTGDEMIIEIPKPIERKEVDVMVDQACALLGIDPTDIINMSEPRRQHYNKILPIDDEVRKQFIWWATDKHQIYSLGRFGTWRPGLQMDDLVKDINLIGHWVMRKDRYAVAKHRS